MLDECVVTPNALRIVISFVKIFCSIFRLSILNSNILSYLELTNNYILSLNISVATDVSIYFNIPTFFTTSNLFLSASDGYTFDFPELVQSIPLIS